MGLTASKDRDILYSKNMTRADFAVASGQTLYKGALLGMVASSGEVSEATTGLQFVGVADSTIDNSDGTATYEMNVCNNHIEAVPYASAPASIVGKAIYARADNAVSTAGSTLHRMGICHSIKDTTAIYVNFGK